MRITITFAKGRGPVDAHRLTRYADNWPYRTVIASDDRGGTLVAEVIAVHTHACGGADELDARLDA